MAIDYAALIRDVPDFPQRGVLFRDITPLLADARALKGAVRAMAAPFRQAGITQVAAIEARGYLLGAPIATALGVGLVPVRKAGKLPRRTYKADYALEYGRATIEMHQDSLRSGQTVLLVDDVLATGGTMAAAIALVNQSGARVAGISVLIEIAALGGRAKLGAVPLVGIPVFALITY